MVKPRFPGHVEAPSATRRATDKWAHDTMRPEQLDSGSTHTSQPQEGCALLHPLQGVSLLSTPLQGGILKPPALRVVVDWLRVLDTAERPQIDHRVCQQLHAIMPLLDTFKAE